MNKALRIVRVYSQKNQEISIEKEFHERQQMSSVSLNRSDLAPSRCFCPARWWEATFVTAVNARNLGHSRVLATFRSVWLTRCKNGNKREACVRLSEEVSDSEGRTEVLTVLMAGATHSIYVFHPELARKVLKSSDPATDEFRCSGNGRCTATPRI